MYFYFVMFFFKFSNVFLFFKMFFVLFNVMCFVPVKT